MSRNFVVLAALDLNQGSTSVLEQSLAVAAGHPDSEIHVVTATEPSMPPGMYVPTLIAERQLPSAEATTEFCRSFFAARADTQPKAARPRVHVHAVLGAAADEIIWLAAHLDADLIVMSTSGRRGLKRLLLGSVAEKVVRLAGCPVYVVREKAHEAAWRVPEIEPVCDDCAARRAETMGRELWCARHAEHHARAHVLGYSIAGEEAPHAWSSSTGT